jgi:MoaD family protein
MEHMERLVMATIKIFGTLRDRAGIGQIKISGGKTIWQILALLGEKYGDLVRRLLLEEKDGELVKRAPVVIIINGHTQVDLRRIVEDGETVTIFPAVAGG